MLQLALNTEIQVAIGIEVAMIGEAQISGGDSSPSSALMDGHIEGLRQIAEDFRKLRSG
jgi:hypothetical protein